MPSASQPSVEPLCLGTAGRGLGTLVQPLSAFRVFGPVITALSLSLKNPQKCKIVFHCYFKWTLKLLGFSNLIKVITLYCRCHVKIL